MKYFLTLLSVVVISASANQCFSQKTFSNSDTWLPSDFDAKTHTLLIQPIQWPKKQQEKMEEFMKSKYPFQFEFVDTSALKADSNYANVSQYRFLLLNNNSRHKMHQGDMTRPSSQQIEIMTFDFYFYDRLTKKTYPATQKGSSWASKTFIAMMNTILKKFE